MYILQHINTNTYLNSMPTGYNNIRTQHNPTPTRRIKINDGNILIYCVRDRGEWGKMKTHRNYTPTHAYVL